MKILALDTAMNACSAAIAVDGRTAARRHEMLGRGHAERIVPMLEEVRGDAGLDYGELDGIAVTVGPGTFTGVRVGLAAARALALAGELPVVAVTTLQALAWNAAGASPVAAAIDARRGEVYVQTFDSGRSPSGAPAAMTPVAAAAVLGTGDVTVIGTGAALLIAARPGLRHADGADEPDAAVIAMHIAGGDIAAAAGRPMPSPLYLRAPDAKLPAGAGDA
jgi:tRNA threonylcarbamoyladenosine biosynthesis protein TsaB